MAEELEQKAIEAVKTWHAQRKSKGLEDFHIHDHRQHFANGELITVGWYQQAAEEGKDREWYVNYVYVVDRELKVFRGEYELIDEIGRRQTTWATELLTASRLAGVIAVIVVVTLIVLLFFSKNQEADERQILIQALVGGFSLILGYFFGKAA